MTPVPRPHDESQVPSIAARRLAVERRRQALENLQRLAVQLETASALDRQAERSNPTLAAVLRERAEERRRIAAVIRAHLDSQRPARAPVAVTFTARPSGNRHQ